MKYWIVFIAMINMFTGLYAQGQISDDRRYIVVNGSAEVIVQPDQIELEVILKEYGSDIRKVGLSSIEKDFFRVLERHGIGMEQVIFDEQGYYWYRWWISRKQEQKGKAIPAQIGSPDRLSVPDVGSRSAMGFYCADFKHDEFQTAGAEKGSKNAGDDRCKGKGLVSPGKRRRESRTCPDDRGSA